ncbi:penicillin acylase family protein [Sphingorhabdus wooponensis]|uniref:Acylase n=1 Tax=Sphingorhabdus wooponensis TaxID=940136 RepID=A0A3R8Q8A3_9SPHN|nr:acylase [Sphingorhabdus wooponensis]RRQ51487.1 acylase [Sphingorhabdus wooponensis]
MRKFLWASLALVGVVAGAGALWEPLAATGYEMPKRSYDVEIVRDEFGVPHINGKTDADTAYGLAFAHSEDDFATIQDVVAMTRGRYGAIAGSDGAKVDYVMHLLGVRETAETRYMELSPEVRAVAEAYAAGVNHYAAKHPEEVRLSKLFPVTGQDIVTGFVLRAPFFYGLDAAIGALTEGKPLPKESAAPMTPIGRDPEMNGSNAFAIAPKRMADGKTWLISNSHQPYEGQVAWYEAVTHSGEGLDMAGALFPGSPFVLLGHNRHLGWTNTVNRPDLIDVYKLVMNKAGDQYRYDGKWMPLSSKRVWLPVKMGPFNLPVPQTIYRSIHGPVIKNDKGYFAIRYAGIDNVKVVEQYYRNTKATNWDEWTKSMAIGGIPATNFIYADKTGRIAYIYNALFPNRKPGHDYTKLLPGDTSAVMWEGPVGFDRYPKIVNPASGFVQNANNTPFLAAGPGSEMNPADYSPYLGIELGMTNRGLRATELLAADTSITPQELLAIKMDMIYSKKSWVGAWMASFAALDLKDAPELAEAQKLLASWDWSSDGKGRADALAERIIRFGARRNWRGEKMPDPRETLQEAVTEFKERFGRIDPPLAEIQRLRRGDVDLAMLGGSDALRATTIWDAEQADGKMRVRHGDSYIMLMRWDKDGKVQSESIQPYGSATNRSESPHYTDQMKLFVAGGYKPVHFEWADAVKNAKRRYRP